MQRRRRNQTSALRKWDICIIKYNIDVKKAPGFDLITGQILKKLPRKGIVKLTNLINAPFRLKHVPELWKVAEVMIPKVGKPPNEASSYRPISLLPIISKLFEKLIRRLKHIIEHKKLVPDHQFGFREQHSTVEQVHRLTNVIETTLEEKKSMRFDILERGPGLRQGMASQTDAKAA